MQKIKNEYVLKNLLKESIEKRLIERFSLYKVDPTYIVTDNYSLRPHRMINFDNAITGDIYSFTDQMDIALLKNMHELGVELNSGFICYFCKFNRDYQNNGINNHSEFHFIIEYHIRVQDACKEYMVNISNLILEEINNAVNEYSNDFKGLKRLPKKLSVTSFDSIWKKYPTLKINDALNQEVINHELCLLFDINGMNKRSINLLGDSKLIYTDKIYGSFYLYIPELQKSTSIGSIYICPTRENVDKYFEDNNLSPEKFEKTINNFPTNDNYLIIDINLSILLMYILNKNNINEIV